VAQFVQGGGTVLPGLSTSPANAGIDKAPTIRQREMNRLMETSVNYENHGSITDYDTMVSMSLGEGSKDYWAELARKGDRRAAIKLACCYEMTGEMAEGLIVINELLDTEDLTLDLKAEALLRKAVLQKDSPSVAWKTINLAPMEVRSELRGKLHNQRARILSDLKKYDDAILEYTAAGYYFELADSPELVGLTHNNLASIYRKKKRFDDAHESVDRCIHLWRQYSYLPCAFDQKALIYIEQKEYAEAEGLALSALTGTRDHHRWRAEFLCTLSKAQAGLGKFMESLRSIQRALEVSDYLADRNLRLVIFASRKISFEIMYQVSDQSATQLALTLAEGNFVQAAKKLGINHSAFIKSFKKHNLTRTPFRRKSIMIREARN
jgi:tetratricopeptide (TPR) repeat protein